MDAMQNGLIFRVRRSARRLADQHRHLRELIPEFERAVELADSAALRSMISRYRVGVVAHFNLEDQVFFPALHGLRSDQTPALDRLSREHEGFLRRLTELRELLTAATVEAFAEGFRKLLTDLGAHEKQEEQLVREVARDAGWSWNNSH